MKRLRAPDDLMHVPIQFILPQVLRSKHAEAVEAWRVRVSGVLFLDIKKHNTFADADPDAVIVSLFRSKGGMIAGWYIAPATTDHRLRNHWRTSPDDNLLAIVAIIRAWEIATTLKRKLCVVDPEDLWSRLFDDN